MDKSSFGLYPDDGLIFLKNTNGQKMDKIRRLVIKSFKVFGFKIEIKTNVNIVDFLDVILNLNKGTYGP